MKSLKRLFTGPHRREGGATPEAPLWDRLDACGIAFRAPMAELITRHGSFPSPWGSQCEACVIGSTTPFIDGEGQQAAFEFADDADMTAPPLQILCSVAASPDHRLNYAKAVHALVKLFGEGEVHSGETSTSRVWRLGHAWLACTVYPPEKNVHLDAPHPRPEAERVAAALRITPSWRTPLSDEEAAWCAQADPLGPPWPAEAASRLITPLTRDLPQDAGLLSGPAITPDGAALVMIRADGLCDILPAAQIETVELRRITAGRSGPSASVSLGYQPAKASAQYPKQPRRYFNLAYLPGDAAALDGAAKGLAARLGVRLNSTDDTDV